MTEDLEPFDRLPARRPSADAIALSSGLSRAAIQLSSANGDIQLRVPGRQWCTGVYPSGAISAVATASRVMWRLFSAGLVREWEAEHSVPDTPLGNRDYLVGFDDGVVERNVPVYVPQSDEPHWLRVLEPESSSKIGPGHRLALRALRGADEEDAEAACEILTLASLGLLRVPELSVPAALALHLRSLEGISGCMLDPAGLELLARCERLQHLECYAAGSALNWGDLPASLRTISVFDTDITAMFVAPSRWASLSSVHVATSADAVLFERLARVPSLRTLSAFVNERVPLHGLADSHLQHLTIRTYRPHISMSIGQQQSRSGTTGRSNRNAIPPGEEAWLLGIDDVRVLLALRLESLYCDGFDEGALSVLAQHPTLRAIYIAGPTGSALQDDDVDALTELVQLTFLMCAIAPDTKLSSLAKLSLLRTLRVCTGEPVDVEEVDWLAQRLPECHIRVQQPRPPIEDEGEMDHLAEWLRQAATGRTASDLRTWARSRAEVDRPDA